MSNPKTALVLGCGAARGLTHIGVLKTLEKYKIPIDIVVGTSMGAMIGGAYAAGLRPEQIEEIACETNWLKVARILFPKRLQMAGLLDGGRVQDFLLALVGERNIQDLKIPFACVATDIWTGDEIVLNSGSLVNAIRASISFPFLFSPMKIDSRLLVDGGVVNPLPTNIARNMGADIIIAVVATPPIDRHIKKMNSGRMITPKKILAPVSSSAFYKRFLNYFDKENHNLSSGKKDDIISPGIRQKMIQVGSIMENMILNLRLEAEPADIIINPDLGDIQFMDFTGAKELITRGQKATEYQQEKIYRLFESRNKPEEKHGE